MVRRNLTEFGWVILTERPAIGRINPMLSTTGRRLMTTAEWHDYGFACGLANIKPDTTNCPGHAEYSAAHQGYRAGLDKWTTEALAGRVPAAPAFDSGVMAADERKRTVMTHEALLGRLLVLARAYEREGDEFSQYMAEMVRDHANDVADFRSRNWEQFEGARDVQMSELRRYRDEALGRPYLDVVL